MRLSYNDPAGGPPAPDVIAWPHRLGDQDAALSRPKRGFESPWGHHLFARSVQALPCQQPAEAQAPADSVAAPAILDYDIIRGAPPAAREQAPRTAGVRPGVRPPVGCSRSEVIAGSPQ